MLCPWEYLRIQRDHIVLLALQLALNCTTATMVRRNYFFSNVMTNQVTGECPDTCVDDAEYQSAGLWDDL
jgi:hypothetical protein